jgi:hypothetical protein
MLKLMSLTRTSAQKEKKIRRSYLMIEVADLDIVSTSIITVSKIIDNKSVIILKI